MTNRIDKEPDANRDPITGAPGAHPLGTGAGAAAGGMAGAAAGTVAAGPVGTVIGAAIGAVAGGLAGKGAAEAVNPTDPVYEEPAADGTTHVYASGASSPGLGRDSVRRADGRAPLERIDEASASHPVGTGAGALAGGFAGAAAGTAVAGPVGTLIGAAAGAVAGGAMGRSAAELIDPSAEDDYWREAYLREPYYAEGRSYDYYGPAYRAGYEGRARYHDQHFDDVEHDLAGAYARYRAEHGAEWPEVRDAARSAWDRADRNVRSRSGM